MPSSRPPAHPAHDHPADDHSADENPAHGHPAREFPPLASEPTATLAALDEASSPGDASSASASADRPQPTAAERLQGRLLLLAAVLLWSSSGLFAKNRVFDDWPEDSRGLLLAFWRFLFAGVVLLTAVRRPRWRWLQLPAGMMFGTLGATYLSAMIFTTAANAIWLQNTAPCWVALFSLWIWGRRPRGREVVALGALVAGVLVIAGCEAAFATGLGKQHLGVLLALASGACFGGTILVFEQLRDEDGGWIVAVNHLLAAAFLAPLALWIGVAPSWGQWPWLVGFGVLQMGVPYLLFFLSLRKLSAQEAALLSLLEPILAPLWVWLVYGQAPAVWTLAGAGLILAGLAYLYWPARPPEAASAEEAAPPA